MRARELILEYNQKKTINTYGQKLYDRLNQEAKENKFAEELFNSINTPDEIVSWIENQDPTQDKKYTDWMIRIYIRGGIKHIEDISSRLGGQGNALYLHNRLSRAGYLEGQDKNIDGYKNITQLEDRIEEYYENEAHDKELDDTTKKFFNSGEAKLLYNGPDYRIVVPKTYKASCYFGSGTRWCTASNKSSEEWEMYSKEGTFYYVLDKSNQSKIAINFGAKEYRDDKDIWIERDELLNQHPRLMQILLKRVGKQKIIKQDPEIGLLMYPDDEQVQIAAVEQDSFKIKDMKNPSEKVKIAAVKKNGFLIKLFDNPSEEMKLAAVKENGFLIDLIDNPNEEMKLAAVKHNVFAIGYIDNPSEEVQLEAVKKTPKTIEFIENPTEKVQLVAVKENELFIEYIDNPSEKVQLAAVKQNGLLIVYFDNPSEEVQIAAVKNTPRAIEFIKNPTEKVKRAAGVE